MITRKEYLLIQLASECNEVAHIISQGLQFGLDDTVGDSCNADRIALEIGDLLGVLKMYYLHGVNNV